MRPSSPQSKGFTLIELMVTILVMVILVVMAAPSFIDFAERSALRGAADSMVASIGTAREEAIKRDQLVRVDFEKVGDGVCLGATVVATSSSTGCSCSATVSSCAVIRYPESERDMQRVLLVGDPAFGAGTSFVIDPRTGMLDQFVSAGSVTLATKKGYQATVRVNPMGRASVCTPGSKGLAGVGACS